MSKVCTKCKESKPEESYHFKNKSTSERRAVCKSCWNSLTLVYKRAAAAIKNESKIAKNAEKLCKLQNEGKVCPKCNILKVLTDYCKNKNRKDGHSVYCRDCKSKEGKAYLAIPEFREAKLEKQKNYRKANSLSLNLKARNNSKRPEYLTFRRAWDVNKRATDIQYKIKGNLRCRVYKAVTSKGSKKSIKTLELLGCTVEYLKKHLESLFLPTMTWDNYGSLWHIDHKTPCAAFDLIDLEQQKVCFHYTNLQPLFAVTTIIDEVEYVGNLNKNDKIL